MERPGLGSSDQERRGRRSRRKGRDYPPPSRSAGTGKLLELGLAVGVGSVIALFIGWALR